MSDVQFAKDIHEHLARVLDLLDVRQNSDVRAAAEELAELLDDPENEVIIDRAMSMLSRALNLRDMLAAAVKKESDDDSVTAEKPDLIETIQKRTENTNRRLDALEADMRRDSLTPDGLRKAEPNASIEDHERRFEANQPAADQQRMPMTVYDLLSNWIVKEERRVRKGGDPRGELIETRHPMYGLVYDVARMIRGSDRDPDGTRFEHLLSKAADVPSLAHIVRLAMTGDLPEGGE